MASGITSVFDLVGSRVADPSLAGELPPDQWFQCVSLVKEYLRGFGLQPGHWGHAIDYWNRTNPAILARFDRLQTNIAKHGDIVILVGLSGNPYGHIGIATGNANAASIEILEQNGETGSGTGIGADAIRLRYVSRGRVAGLLRPKLNERNDMVIPDADNYYWRYGQDLAMKFRGRHLTRDEFRQHLVGKTDLRAIEILSDDAEAQRVQHAQNVGMVAVRDDWQGQIANLLLQLNEFANRPTQGQLEQLQKELAVCKENLHVTDAQLETFRKKDVADTEAGDTLLRRLGQLIKRYWP